MDLTVADRYRNRIKVGSKVKIIGMPEDSTVVYFADDMKKFLNDGNLYTIDQIEGSRVVKLKETTWCWDTRNIQSISHKRKPKPKPVLFEPSMLDI